MKTSNLLIASAVAVALALPFVSTAQGGPAPKPKFEAEKCYGIAKAGKNDCQTANSSCAGTSKRNSQGDAWIYMPAGSCDRLVGGSTQPKRT
ncbi:MAG: BufA1 family periplasmic bufferin-type metallophore [Candidatus Rokuibacteriota bacterium]